MCVVSMIMDYGINNWPLSEIPPDPTKKPFVNPTKDWTPEKFEKLKKLLEIAKELDLDFGEPDCEDLKKEKYIQQIKDNLEKLRLSKKA